MTTTEAIRTAALDATPLRPEHAPYELTVVVPTRNEVGNVRPLFDRLCEALDGRRWEVVFVDDDSPDGTADEVRRLARSNAQVRCLQRIGRRGLTTACIEGILSSSADFVAVLDGDMQHDERLLPAMMDIVRSDDLDLAIGSRHVAGGSLGEWDESRRRVSGFATWLARLATGTDLTDPMSGFFLIRRTAFDGAVRNMSGRGFKILLDLFASSPRPLRFRELPYEFRLRQHGESKLDTFIALEFLNFLLEKTVGRYVPVTFILFAFVGASGVFVQMAALALALTVLPFTVAKTVATVVAMASNFALNNVITYRDRRLRGRRFLTGLLSYFLICGTGAIADIGIASILYTERNTSWWLSGLAGTVVGSVWNYAMSRVFTWRTAR